MESIVANKVLLIVTAADCCHGFWFWCFLLLVIAKFLLFFSVFDIFSLAIFEGGIDVVCLSTLLWVSLSMMLKNALFFSNLEDQHWKNRKKFMFTTKLNIWYAWLVQMAESREESIRFNSLLFLVNIILNLWSCCHWCTSYCYSLYRPSSST